MPTSGPDPTREKPVWVLDAIVGSISNVFEGFVEDDEFT